jgi:hypothetical protein
MDIRNGRGGISSSKGDITMGFKCKVLGYDISDEACNNCGVYCKLNPNCVYTGEIKK